MSNALKGSMGGGLNLDMGCQIRNGKPTLVCKASNEGEETIARIDLKFNKNFLGIQTAGRLPLNGQLAPGNSQLTEVPLVLSSPPVPKSPLDTEVQIAARSERTSGENPVHMFTHPIPGHIFFTDDGEVEQQTFLKSWKSIPQTEEQSVSVRPRGISIIVHCIPINSCKSRMR